MGQIRSLSKSLPSTFLHEFMRAGVSSPLEHLQGGAQTSSHSRRNASLHVRVNLPVFSHRVRGEGGEPRHELLQMLAAPYQTLQLVVFFSSQLRLDPFPIHQYKWLLLQCCNYPNPQRRYLQISKKKRVHLPWLAVEEQPSAPQLSVPCSLSLSLAMGNTTSQASNTPDLLSATDRTAPPPPTVLIEFYEEGRSALVERGW